jgi:hypothetical protein
MIKTQTTIIIPKKTNISNLTHSQKMIYKQTALAQTFQQIKTPLFLPLGNLLSK